MIITIMRPITWLILLLLTVTLNLEGKETIVWLVPDFPPANIIDGQFKNQGSNDLIVHLVTQELKDYVHQTKLVNMKRAQIELSNQSNSCISSFIPNEDRKKIAHFSTPGFFYPSMHIIFKNESLGHFLPYVANNKVSINKVFRENKDLVLGVVNDRGYGSQIDKLINDNEKSNQIFVRNGRDISYGLLKMLSNNRIHYTIEYPFIVKYIKEKYALNANFRTFPIEESSNYIFGSFACSKSPLGKVLIERINSIIVKLKTKDNYREAFERWLPDETKEIYRKDYQEIFLKQTN